MSKEHVFITGSTGVVGSAVVEELLKKTDWRIILLIRADCDEHLLKRFAQMLNFWQISLESTEAQRLIPVRGDATLKHFGLKDEPFEQFGQTVTHIIQCASSVKLNMSQEEALEDCLLPVERMFELAQRCQQKGCLKKIEYISTVGVNGRNQGLILEKYLPGHKLFHNTYEEAKAKAEDLIWEKARQGFSVTVHRPSMVIGNSQTGKIIHFQVFYHLAQFLTGRFTKGFVPLIKNLKLDIIPNDIVASGIVASLLDSKSINKTFHWSTGPQLSWTIEELRIFIDHFFRKQDSTLVKTKLISYTKFLLALKILSWLSAADKKRKLKSLYSFLEYAGDEQWFDNTQAQHLLAQNNIVIPPVDSYLHKVLEYYVYSQIKPAK